MCIRRQINSLITAHAIFECSVGVSSSCPLKNHPPFLHLIAPSDLTLVFPSNDHELPSSPSHCKEKASTWFSSYDKIPSESCSHYPYQVWLPCTCPPDIFREEEEQYRRTSHRLQSSWLLARDNERWSILVKIYISCRRKQSLLVRPRQTLYHLLQTATFLTCIQEKSKGSPPHCCPWPYNFRNS